jgi:integrase/recombinase XerD
MTEVTDKFTKDLKIRNRAGGTQDAYLETVKSLEQFYPDKSLEDLSDDEVQEYIFHLIERGLSWSYIQVHVSAFRFFYGKTLRRNLSTFVIPCPKGKKKIPNYMSYDEVRAALEASSGNPRQAAFFSVLYGCGLRAKEACGLRIADLDSANRTIWVRNGKGGKDRGVHFPNKVYDDLARYWRAFRFNDYVFPGYEDPGKPMLEQRARDWFREIKSMAGIKKAGSLHMWRHTYAVHMLDAGHRLLTIKRALGHSSLNTTMIYLQMAAPREEEKDSPIDHLFT